MALALEVHVVQDGLGKKAAVGTQTDSRSSTPRPSHSAHPPHPRNLLYAYSVPGRGLIGD